MAQSTHVLKLLDEFHKNEGTPIATPMETNLKLSNVNDIRKLCNINVYRQEIG